MIQLNGSHKVYVFTSSIPLSLLAHHHPGGHFQCLSDSVALRHIKLRNLLDRVQAKLAYYASFTDVPYMRSASMTWRNRLEGLNTDDRVRSAWSFLQQPDTLGYGNAALASFLACDEAMRLAVQHRSILREQGDQVAHSTLP